MEIQVTRTIDAPPEIVWTLITDIANSPQVISGIDSVKILGGPEGFGVGTRWRETRTMFGKEATEEMEVSSVTEGTSYTVIAASHGMLYESIFTIQPRGADTCTLTMLFGGEPTSTMSRAMAVTIGRLFAGQTRKALEKDLADIATAAEARTA